ncbi:hypothetical protein EV182_001455 [Spiromyces aspiralis]|uniref:Uncharacterized protein n=1 Tax=Spiromyces aspiralis TaxID=68401 RepID=A0ACC1HH56_9FUNG|nr:hypothetical protein EV182_001455 [Spiromyces aspiralis]
MTHGRWSWPARTFAAIAAIQSSVTVSLEAYFLSLMTGTRSSLPPTKLFYIVYAVGFLIAQLFSLGMGLYALRTRSGALVVSTVAFDIALIMYALTQAAQTAKALHAVAAQTMVVILLAAAMAAKGWITWRYLRSEFGWRIYRALGANMAFRRMFALQQALVSIVFLDGFFLFALWLQLIAVVALQKGRSGGNIVQMIFLFIYSVVVIGSTLYAITNERLRIMTACLAAYALAPAYLIYKIVAVNRKPTGSNPATAAVDYDVYTNSHKYLTIFLVILLVLVVATFTLGIFVRRNFGRGLRERFNEVQVVDRGEIDLEAMDETAKPADDQYRTISLQSYTNRHSYSAFYATMLSNEHARRSVASSINTTATTMAAAAVAAATATSRGHYGSSDDNNSKLDISSLPRTKLSASIATILTERELATINGITAPPNTLNKSFITNYPYSPADDTRATKSSSSRPLVLPPAVSSSSSPASSLPTHPHPSSSSLSSQPQTAALASHHYYRDPASSSTNSLPPYTFITATVTTTTSSPGHDFNNSIKQLYP